MAGKAIAAAVAPELAGNKRLEIWIEGGRWPVDPRTDNHGNQCGYAERNYCAQKRTTARCPLLVVLRPTLIETGGENPSTQQRIQKQNFADFVSSSVLGYAMEKHL